MSKRKKVEDIVVDAEEMYTSPEPIKREVQVFWGLRDVKMAELNQFIQTVTNAEKIGVVDHAAAWANMLRFLNMNIEKIEK